MKRLVNGDVKAVPDKIRGAGKSRRTAADNRDFFADFVRSFKGFSLFYRKVADVSFKPADRHAAARFFAAYAMKFALLFLRADSAANRRQTVVAFQTFHGVFHVAALNKTDKFRDIHADGTAASARCVFAI